MGEVVDGKRFEAARRARALRADKTVGRPSLITVGLLFIIVSSTYSAWTLIMDELAPASSRGSASSPDMRLQPVMAMCSGGRRYNCVVDGDTVWINGQNLRLESYDTPEPYYDVCGGAAEVALAHTASGRLQELLNSNEWTVEVHELDSTGERHRATIRIDGRDVGETLMAEGLARSWPDGPEFWC